MQLFRDSSFGVKKHFTMPLLLSVTHSLPPSYCFHSPVFYHFMLLNISRLLLGSQTHLTIPVLLSVAHSLPASYSFHSPVFHHSIFISATGVATGGASIFQLQHTYAILFSHDCYFYPNTATLGYSVEGFYFSVTPIEKRGYERGFYLPAITWPLE